MMDESIIFWNICVHVYVHTIIVHVYPHSKTVHRYVHTNITVSDNSVIFQNVVELILMEGRLEKDAKQ